MERKKFGSTLLLGTLLIAVFAILWNGERTIPTIWRTVSSVLCPILGGIAIAFIISIPAAPIRKVLEKHMAEKKAMMLASALSAIFLAFAAVLIISLIIPEFITACRILVSQLSAFASDSAFWSRIDIGSIPFAGEIIVRNPEGGIALSPDTMEWLSSLRIPLIDITVNTIAGTASAVAMFFVSAVFAFYFLMNRELLKKDARRIFGRRIGKAASARLSYASGIISSSFSRYAVAQVLEALIIGSICFIGMLVFRMPYAAAVSAFTGLMSLIPIYGAVIGALAGAFIIAVSEPLKGLVFLIFIFILQQLEGDLIYPRVVGTSTGLPPIYVFASVTLGGILFGLLGMMLAVPIVSAAYTMLGSEDEATPCSDPDTEGIAGGENRV